MIRKIQDTFNDGRSDADTYFPLAERRRFYKLFRNNLGNIPTNFETNSENTILTTKEFNLRGIQFGNWLTTEDKFDYLSAFWIGMNDLNTVLKFPAKNLGLNNRLGVCFGSRGIANSKAHYQPKTDIINLNRYIDNTGIEKMTRFLNTGGAGSLAHEYGHFLDAVFGGQLEQIKTSFWLTDTCTEINKMKPNEIDKVKFPIRYQMAVIFEKLLFEKKGKIYVHSKYANRLLSIDSSQNGAYYRKNVEIWARLFECYISWKMNKKGLTNSFLSKTWKYTQSRTNIYVNTAEMTKLEKDIDKLIVLLRKNA
jgi:hypothetical protein